MARHFKARVKNTLKKYAEKSRFLMKCFGEKQKRWKRFEDFATF